MVFVWSYLTDGDPAYTLVQVAANDLIMLVLFAPIVMFLLGVADVVVPSKVLITSVVVFIVIPLAAGYLTRTSLLKSRGIEWFENRFLPKFHPVTVVALLLTLLLIFAFQADNLTNKWVAVILIAIPIIIQVYFNSGLTYMLMRFFEVPHNVASPGSLIGASNFFELAVAVAITLFGPSSGAALACVVGVLVEVPVMLSVCKSATAPGCGTIWLCLRRLPLLLRNSRQKRAGKHAHGKPIIPRLATSSNMTGYILLPSWGVHRGSGELPVYPYWLQRRF